MEIKKINIDVIENEKIEENKEIKLEETKTIKDALDKYYLTMKTIGLFSSNTYKKMEEASKIINDTIKPLFTQIINFTSYFHELEQIIIEAKKNPDSLINWSNYLTKLNEYIWTIPYDIETSQMKYIFENVNSEKEFDNYMNKYFDKDKLDDMFHFIEENIAKKHKVILCQIKTAIYNKMFSLAIVGIMAIIDDLCSYFLYNKGNSARVNMFKPIIENLKDTGDDFTSYLILKTLSLNLNIIYQNVDFNKKINIDTNKKARRNPCMHGKAFSNRRVDALMLLNTMYYLIIIQKKLVKYRKKLKMKNENNVRVFYLI